MKKVLLSLAVVFVMSSFTSADTGIEKMNIETIVLEEVNLDEDYSSNISLADGAKVSEIAINICVEIGAFVLSEASKGGYSFHEALTMSLNAMTACEALVLVGLIANK